MKKLLLLLLGVILVTQTATAQCGYSGSGELNITGAFTCSNTHLTMQGRINLKDTVAHFNNVTLIFNNTGKATESDTVGIYAVDNATLYLTNSNMTSIPGCTPDATQCGYCYNNTWIFTRASVFNEDSKLYVNGTAFTHIGANPIGGYNYWSGIIWIYGDGWVDNAHCTDSCSCFITGGDPQREFNHSLQYIKNSYFQDIKVYPYLISGGGTSRWMQIVDNEWGPGNERYGTGNSGSYMSIHDNIPSSGSLSYPGFSFRESHEVQLYNLKLNNSAAALEFNNRNYNTEAYNIDITDGGIGVNYGNHNLTFHDMNFYTNQDNGAHNIIGSSVVVGQPNYDIHMYNIFWNGSVPAGLGLSGADGIDFAGENSTFDNFTMYGFKCAWECSRGIGEVVSYNPTVWRNEGNNYTKMSMTTFNVGIFLKNYSSCRFQDIKMVDTNTNIKLMGGNNHDNRFINVTHNTVAFDNNHDVFDYYNYLTVNAVGNLNFDIEVRNRTGGLLTTGSTTTGTRRLEVEEFRKTNLATTLVYPHTITISGLLADTSYNISVDGVYKESRSTDAGGELNFQENITDNTRIEIEPTDDIFPPFITVITPENTSYPHEALTAEVSLDENGDWCGYSLDGAANVTMDGADRSWTKLLTELAQAQYRIKFWCNDSLGYMGSSDEVFFTIRECVSDANCGIGKYCSNLFECLDKKSDGASCGGDSQCSSNECCHSVCRATCPYCGDGICDSGLGESYVGCSLDCTGPPEGGSPDGGTPGGGTEQPATGGGSGGGGGAGGGTDISCFDNIMNQNETGIDCGGSCKACMSCTDGMQNQEETGVDCGGPCPSCAIIPGSCYDGIKNQGETGIDCGGPCSSCRKVISLQEKFTLTTQVPSDVDGGAQYGVEVEIENTGDVELYDLNVKVGDQNKKMSLDIGEKKTLAFYLTAPQQEGDYAVKVEVSGDKVNGQQQTKIHVKGTSLVLRASTVDDVMYITTQTNYSGGLIELEVTKDGNLVYADFIQDKDHVTELQAGNYLVKASLKVDGKPIASKEITPIVEDEVEPEDMTWPIMIPILLINFILIVDIIKNIRRR